MVWGGGNMATEDIQTVPVMFFDQELSGGRLQAQEFLVRPKDFPALFGGDLAPFPGGRDPHIQWPAFPISTAYGELPAGVVLPVLSNPQDRYTTTAGWYLWKVTSSVAGAGFDDSLNFGRRTLIYTPSRQSASTIPSYDPENYDHQTESYNSVIRHFWPKTVDPSATVTPAYERFENPPNDPNIYDSAILETAYLWLWEDCAYQADLCLFKGVPVVGALSWNGRQHPNTYCGIGGIHSKYYNIATYAVLEIANGSLNYVRYAGAPFDIDSYIVEPRKGARNLPIIAQGLAMGLIFFLASSAGAVAGDNRKRRRIEGGTWQI